MSADSPVGVIEAFVAELDLFKLGFEGVQPKTTWLWPALPVTDDHVTRYG